MLDKMKGKYIVYNKKGYVIIMTSDRKIALEYQKQVEK
jgi:hypothetical protein|tara:strand:+ start:458 stop:571 length:114 start_codon:yes stop_codon:yes gene_type:complete